MANIILNGKTVVTQTGNDEPVLGSNVILGNDSLASATFPNGMIIGSEITFFNEITSYTQASGANAGNYGLLEGLDIDDLTITYTPKKTTSKLFISGAINFSTSAAVYNVLRIKRSLNGAAYVMHEPVMNTDTAAMPGTNTRIGIASYSTNTLPTSGWHTMNLSFGFIDLNHISSVGQTVSYRPSHTYSGNDATTKTLYLNRNYYPTNDYGSHTQVSYIKIEEIEND